MEEESTTQTEYNEPYIVNSDNVEDKETTIVNALNTFYENYLIETVDGTFQVFKSFTYGEMAICLLLVAILFTQILKMFFEVLR